jgi:hypothetical protein
MQKYKINLQAQYCSCFSKEKFKINLKHEICIPALLLTSLVKLHTWFETFIGLVGGLMAGNKT